jgi:hypothetical protein
LSEKAVRFLFPFAGLNRGAKCGEDLVLRLGWLTEQSFNLVPRLLV